jgi:hypothetical protein
MSWQANNSQAEPKTADYIKGKKMETCYSESYLSLAERQLRRNIRNFLFLEEHAELQLELEISLERGDKPRARFIQELIDEKIS